MEEFQHWARVTSDVLGNEKYHGYAGDWARKLVEFALKCDEINLNLLTMAFPIPTTLIWLWRRDEKKLALVAEGNVPPIIQAIFTAMAAREEDRVKNLRDVDSALASLFGSLDAG